MYGPSGNQGGAESFFSFEYGFQVFDLCADQICKLMEKPDMNIGRISAFNIHVVPYNCLYLIHVVDVIVQFLN